MPTPLFILGKHRSGTTFLSNLLMDHPKIAAIFWVSKKDNLIGGMLNRVSFSILMGGMIILKAMRIILNLHLC